MYVPLLSPIRGTCLAPQVKMETSVLHEERRVPPSEIHALSCWTAEWQSNK
jgi:hypothetical protein